MRANQFVNIRARIFFECGKNHFLNRGQFVKMWANQFFKKRAKTFLTRAKTVFKDQCRRLVNEVERKTVCQDEGRQCVRMFQYTRVEQTMTLQMSGSTSQQSSSQIQNITVPYPPQHGQGQPMFVKVKYTEGFPKICSCFSMALYILMYLMVF